MKIVLITETYPFLPGEEFLEQEVSLLSRAGYSVTILPILRTSNRRIVPPDVHVCERTANLLSRPKASFLLFARVLLSRLVFGELLRSPACILRPKVLRRIITEAFRVVAICDSLGFLNIDGDLDNVVLYSYWFLSGAIAGIWYRKQVKKRFLVIARAHGYDIHEERWPARHIPFRRWLGTKVDLVLAASEYGASVIRRDRPALADRVRTLHIGVVRHGKLGQIPMDRIHIVSCSYIVPLKRVHVIAEICAEFAKAKADMPVCWTHIGDGPGRGTIEQQAKSLLSHVFNLEIQLVGSISNSQVLEFYAHTPISVFVTATMSEGGCPVSISEAASFGIPVVAPAIGGIPEQVTNDVGVVVTANAPTQDYVEAILRTIETDSPILRRARKSSIYERYDVAQCTDSLIEYISGSVMCSEP